MAAKPRGRGRNPGFFGRERKPRTALPVSTMMTPHPAFGFSTAGAHRHWGSVDCRGINPPYWSNESWTPPVSPHDLQQGISPVFPGNRCVWGRSSAGESWKVAAEYAAASRRAPRTSTKWERQPLSRGQSSRSRQPAQTDCAAIGFGLSSKNSSTSDTLGVGWVRKGLGSSQAMVMVRWM